MPDNTNASDSNDNDRKNDEPLVTITNPNVEVTLPDGLQAPTLEVLVGDE